MRYVIVIKKYDRKYEGFYKYFYRKFNGYREVRDYLVKNNLCDSEYTVFKETNIKIKKVRGFAN